MHQMAYRTLQIQNTIVMNLMSYINAIGFTSSILSITVGMFSLIRFWNVIDESSKGILLLTVELNLIILYSVGKLASRIYENSTSFSESFLENDKQLSAAGRKWFAKTCRPIKISIGSFFTLRTREIFLGVLSNILGKVVDLLVTFSF